MNMPKSFTRALLAGTALVAFSAGFQATPAAAAQQAGLLGGGSTLASSLMRQIFDCYGVQISGDKALYSLPATCSNTVVKGAIASTATSGSDYLYAGVGSGRGVAGFIAHDANQLVRTAVSGTNTITLLIPATIPEFINSGVGAATPSALASYPYPSIQFGASDSPLASAVTSLTAVTYAASSPTTIASYTATNAALSSKSYTVTTQGVATYSAASYGNPIQVPLFAVPVAIAINNNGLNQLHSGYTTTGSTAIAGGGIQLSPAQLCAIFSGTVTDWNSSATIATFVTGTASATATTLFYSTNTGNGSAASAYASSSLPIKVQYRSDGSGTTFILTNYLSSVCPALDNGANNYAKIFTTANGTVTVGTQTFAIKKLPTNNFSDLIANINAVKGGATATIANWTGNSGSLAVAQAVGNTNTATQNGAIGYVSPDFTAPYAKVADNIPVTEAPISASLQNEAQRVAGTPVAPTARQDSTGTKTGAFVGPNAANASVGFAKLASPATTWSYNDYNVYGQNYTTVTTAGSDKLIAGKSILGIATGTNAYPLVGTTFLDLYSCYASTAVKATVTNFLTSYFSATTATNGAYAAFGKILSNNGFGVVPATFASGILSEYVSTTNANAIAAKSDNARGCSGVTGSGA